MVVIEAPLPYFNYFEHNFITKRKLQESLNNSNIKNLLFEYTFMKINFQECTDKRNLKNKRISLILKKE